MIGERSVVLFFIFSFIDEILLNLHLEYQTFSFVCVLGFFFFLSFNFESAWEETWRGLEITVLIALDFPMKRGTIWTIKTPKANNTMSLTPVPTVERRMRARSPTRRSPWKPPAEKCQDVTFGIVRQ